MTVNIEFALELINLLDIKETHRKYYPQYSVVNVGASGQILDVFRHKEPPTEEILRQRLDVYPESVQFCAIPGMYNSIQDLQDKIESCVQTHRNHGR